MDVFSKQQLEDKVAEVIDPAAYENQTWDKDRQYDAIKKAGEILEIMFEELPHHFKEIVVGELEDDDDIKVLSEGDLEDLTALSEHATVQGLEDSLVFREGDFIGLRTVAEFIKHYDFEDLP